MGGLLHLFDFNQSSMARKFFANKSRDDDGLEAPRNSLEMQVETMKGFNRSGDATYAYPVEDDWSERSYYPVEASMKKLINEEICKQSNSRRNTPNIVARLMGMDTLPIDTKSAFQTVNEKNNDMEVKSLKKEKNGKNLAAEISYNLNSFRHMESKDKDTDKDTDRWRSLEQKLDKPRPREHPQEEELQRFKKEFEAFQAARFKECSKFAEVGSISRRQLAQENLNKEKMAHHNNSLEPKISTLKPISHERGSLKHRRHNSELFTSEQKESPLLRSRSLSRDVEFPSVGDAPTKIVILKPGPDRISDYEESWASPLEDLEERGSMEDFLQEVKERLKCELQGKTLERGSVVRGSGIETPFREKPSDPKRIARNIAKHVRESVGKEQGLTLQRSESTKSYRSEVQFEKEGQGMQTRSFRHGDNASAVNRDLSPRNLIRSLSAPVSGTSFGQLLLEDRHVLTGAHIRRKHEVLDGVMPADMRGGKKERFNFKEKVSHLKYSFSLRRKLFSGKIQSMQESLGSVNDFMGGINVNMNLRDRHENSTEVPPSPASLCSSTQEEFWRQADYLSPISTPDVTIGEDNMPQVFRDINSNLNELRRQLNELDSDRTENIKTKENAAEPEVYEMEDEAEAYIRDLLVASGFYDGSSDKSLSRWDPFAKPISNSVFEKVEESYRKAIEENEITIKDHNEKKVDRRVLLDLLNEALSALLGPPVTMSKFRRKMIGYSVLPPPRGRKLLESVWEIIRRYLYPPTDGYCSLDSMVEHDLGSIPWCGLMAEEINVIGREVECVIIGELVEETLQDMLL